jgi:hypothetical protein
MKCSKFKSESELNMMTRRYKGITSSPIMCPWSSWHWVPGDVPMRGFTIGPHELATISAEIRHLLYTQLKLQANFEQLKLSKTDPSTWP